MKVGFMRAMRTLHKWLALVVGIQLVLWTVSGLVFAFLDEEKVSAAGSLRSLPPAVLPRGARLLQPGLLPGIGSGELVDVTLQPLHDQWVYRLRFVDRVELRHAADGAPFVVNEARVRELATERYGGSGALEAVALRAAPVLEARGAGAVWDAAFDDPGRTRLYFSAEDGGFVAARNDSWRLFDVFWMLHTMDYRGRDDFNHPLVILFTTGALWIGISGALLLVQSFRPARPGR